MSLLRMLGCRGQVTIKSRRYFTTMGVLRVVRAEHVQAQGERLLAVTAAIRERESCWVARQLADDGFGVES